MSQVKDDFRRLLEGLFIGTSNGSVSWSYDSSENLCEAKIGQGYVQVVRETDPDGDYYSYVKVLDKEKQVVDTIYGGSVGTSLPVHTAHKDYWQLMNELQELAGRQALGADKLIHDMLKDLGFDKLSLDEVPF